MTERIDIQVQVDAARAARNMDSVAKSTQGIGDQADSTDKKIGKLGDGLKKLGPVGAVAAAAVALGFSTTLANLGAGNDLQNQLGLDDSSAAQAGKDAGAIFAANYGDSITDVTDALRVSVQQGLGSMDDGTANAAAQWLLNIKSTFEADGEEVGRAAAKAISTGLVDDIGDAQDLITRGFQVFGKDSDFLDSLNEYSTQFRDLGLSGKDALGLFKQGLKGGARDTDLVADAFKELNIRVKGLDVNSTSALHKLGLNANEMADAFAKGGPKARDALALITGKLSAVKDPADRSRLSMKLFGTQSEDLAGALGLLDLNTAAKGFTKVAGAAKRLDDNIGKDPGARFEKLRRSVMAGLGSAASATLLPAAEGLLTALEGIGSAVEAVGGFISTWSPVIIGFGVTLAILNAGAIAAAVSSGALTVAIIALGVAEGVSAVAGGALAAVMALLASPFVLVGAAVAGLVAGLVVLWKKNEGFRNWVKGAWEDISGWIGGAAEDIGGFFSGIPHALEGIFNSIVNTFISRINTVIGIMNSAIDLYNKIPLAPDIGSIGTLSPVGGSERTDTVQASGTDSSHSVPRLAEGGILRGTGRAIVGDAGEEELRKNADGSLTVTPLENVPGGRGGGKPTVVFNVRDNAVRTLLEALLEDAEFVGARAT